MKRGNGNLVEKKSWTGEVPKRDWFSTEKKAAAGRRKRVIDVAVWYRIARKSWHTNTRYNFQKGKSVNQFLRRGAEIVRE